MDLISVDLISVDFDFNDLMTKATSLLVGVSNVNMMKWIVFKGIKIDDE